MTRRAILAAVAAGALCAPAAADAKKPAICTDAGVAEVLAANDEQLNAGVGQIECGDVTSDGRRDAVFTILSGGTAGPTQFGVIAGRAELLLIDDGYRVTVDVVNARRFDVQQPVYKEDDANCCPSAFRFTSYRFRDGEFKAGKSKRYKKFKRRFSP